MRIAIFGNSGSGKSTIARGLAMQHKLAHLDLDTLAWLPGVPPTRRCLEESEIAINRFTSIHANWVVEGCYSDLLQVVINNCTEIVFLNPGIESCVNNCKLRPWEPHKYPSKEAQDANLEMLIEWVKSYAVRDDNFSLKAHRSIFEGFRGKKSELTSEKASR